MVSGKYVKTFAEASHVLFNGHLDDPGFRQIAIQKLSGIGDGYIDCQTSGRIKIEKSGGKEYVILIYNGFFGREKTKGFPFKDSSSDRATAPTTK